MKQYQIVCNHCKQIFAIEEEAQRMVKCNCPFCNTLLNIVTPIDEHQLSVSTIQDAKNEQKNIASSSKPSLLRNIIIVYLVFVSVSLLIAFGLYVFFSLISK